MGKRLYPTGKPCKCGCGQPAAKNIGPNGENRGWYKFATGHQPPPPLTNPATHAKTFAARQAQRLRTHPPGSRRLRVIYGKNYWEVKLAAPRLDPGGKRRWWYLEHRVIIEQRLGRRLLTSEHVHHRDDDGLNNGLHADGKDNLQLMDGGDHMRLTNTNAARDMCKCECPHCGAKLKHFKRLGKRKRA